jgi:hypothetical protein
MNWQLRDPGIRQGRSGKAGYARFFCFADAPDWTAIAFSIQAVCCYCIIP